MSKHSRWTRLATFLVVIVGVKSGLTALADGTGNPPPTTQPSAPGPDAAPATQPGDAATEDPDAAGDEHCSLDDAADADITDPTTYKTEGITDYLRIVI